MRLLVSAFLSVAIVTPALADAITYEGTLDGRPILVELAVPLGGPVGGRYAFPAEGKDIPLDPAASPEGMYYFAEEAPCGEGNCIANDEGIVDMPPYAATWGLTIGSDGSLRGTRSLEGEKTKAINVELTELARRPLSPQAATPQDLHMQMSILAYDPVGVIDQTTAPYETRLLAGVDKTVLRTETLGGGEIEYVADPRTKFAFPRLLSLPGGASTQAINKVLSIQHDRMSLAALDCLSLQYAAWGQSDLMGGAGGTLGDYDKEMVEVSYLSSSLISWTQSGSLYCAGAHPYNHMDVFNYDVRTGEPLDLRLIFSGWVPRDYMSEDVVDTETALANPADYFWGPSAELAAYVTGKLNATDYEPECIDPDLMLTSLAVRFIADGQATFVASGYPHVMSMCNGDLFSVPLAELKPFLAPTAKDYFPDLDL